MESSEPPARQSPARGTGTAHPYNRPVPAGLFDEAAFFQAIHRSGARALLIGRRAMVLLGLPVLTADYDFWIAIDDIARFNEAADKVDLQPTLEPGVARRRGRYVLENDEHVDVLVARSVPTVEGRTVTFDEVWAGRQPIALAEGIVVHVPSVAGLILTKQFAARPKDLEDIRLLRILQSAASGNDK